MSAGRVKNGHTHVQWMVAILANISVFIYGFENSWISPMSKILQSEDSPVGEPLSDYEISWIASLMCFAGVFATPIYAYIADRFGRKVAVMAIMYPQALSWALKLYPTITTLTLSRLCGGLAAGGCFNVVPMYVKEISQDSIRGTLGSLLILSQNLGGLFMFIIGAYLNYYTVQWSVIGVPIVAAIFMIKAPEAPAFLVKRGKMDEAIATVASLRGLDKEDKRVQEEIDCMKKEEETFRSLPNIQLKMLFTDEKWRRSVIIFFISGTLHGWSGAYAILVYALTILTYSSSDFSISPEVQSFSFPIVMILSCMILALTIEKVGRKRLLVAAYLASSVTFGVLATSLLVRQFGWYVPGWLPLLVMIINVFAYAGGVSSLTYIIMTEVFNFQIRSKVLGLIVTYIWFIESLQLLIYAPISKFFGYPALFYVFTVVNFIGAIFTIIYIPETKGKSEEEIQRIIRRQQNKNDLS